mmetsp:Transcript_73106/g.156621  ORF Transcript_73106/g.156621 Transcript_73106/m.156621 type:complete len:200 (+) Transcript_73106:357-956(+)
MTLLKPSPWCNDVLDETCSPASPVLTRRPLAPRCNLGAAPPAATAPGNARAATAGGLARLRRPCWGDLDGAKLPTCRGGKSSAAATACGFLPLWELVLGMARPAASKSTGNTVWSRLPAKGDRFKWRHEASRPDTVLPRPSPLPPIASEELATKGGLQSVFTDKAGDTGVIALIASSSVGSCDPALSAAAEAGSKDHCA